MREVLRFDGPIIECTVKHEAGRWFACFAVRVADVLEALPERPTIGVDVGVKELMTDSHGERYLNPRALAGRLRTLKRVDKSIARSRKAHPNLMASALTLIHHGCGAHIPRTRNVTDPFEIDAPLHFALGSGGLSTSMCSIKAERALAKYHAGPIARRHDLRGQVMEAMPQYEELRAGRSKSLSQRLARLLTLASSTLPHCATVLGHANVSTTAIYTTAMGAEARELVSRLW